MRPSEEIALVVSDYDATHGVLSITKARVQGIDKDMTKTGEDRRIVLCPRAVAILERQLQLRESAMRAGLVKHEHLFFTDPVRTDSLPGLLLLALAMHVEAARHPLSQILHGPSHVGELESDDRPQSLLVAKEHGHRLTTMSVYAAWSEGAAESDIIAIGEAMTCTTRPLPDPPTGQASSDSPAPSLVVRCATEDVPTRTGRRFRPGSRWDVGQDHACSGRGSIWQ